MTKFVASLSFETTPLAKRPTAKAVKAFLMAMLEGQWIDSSVDSPVRVERVTVRAVDFDRPRNLKN